MDEDIIREKLIKRVKREKQAYIADKIGVTRQRLSDFKLGLRRLQPESLQALADYLENH